MTTRALATACGKEGGTLVAVKAAVAFCCWEASTVMAVVAVMAALALFPMPALLAAPLSVAVAWLSVPPAVLRGAALCVAAHCVVGALLQVPCSACSLALTLATSTSASISLNAVASLLMPADSLSAAALCVAAPCVAAFCVACAVMFPASCSVFCFLASRLASAYLLSAFLACAVMGLCGPGLRGL